MGDIINNIVVMTRGDTFTFDLTIYDDSESDGRYKLKGNDALYLGIMDPGQPFEVALVRKKFTVDNCDAMGNLVICLEPEDTIDLCPGTYYYAIKLKMDHEFIDPITNEPTGEYVNDVTTIVNKTKFFIID